MPYGNLPEVVEDHEFVSASHCHSCSKLYYRGYMKRYYERRITRTAKGQPKPHPYKNSFHCRDCRNAYYRMRNKRVGA